MNNHEVTYEEYIKLANNFSEVTEVSSKEVVLRVRFYPLKQEGVEFPDGVYTPIVAVPIKLTEKEIDKYGGYEIGTDCTRREKINEIKRINLTKWKISNDPFGINEIANVKTNNILWLYYNGNECAWKFFLEPEITGKGYIEYLTKKQDKFINRISRYCNYYFPHCDRFRNFGDESVHAVYKDLK